MIASFFTGFFLSPYIIRRLGDQRYGIWALAFAFIDYYTLFDFGFNDPTKLDLNGTSYQKSGDKWMSGSTQYEAGTLQSVIDKLRDLSATKFADKMGGTQLLTVGITSGDNHRVEKVTINKDGDAYDAQRDGEPAVYVIDAKNIDDLQKAIMGIKRQAPSKK